MQLTRSSYKITSFVDFQPFLQGFQSVDKYLNDLLADINDPTYFQKLITPFHDVKVTPFSNDSKIIQFLNSPACSFHPYACQAKMKFEQYHLEIQYVYKVFCAITAIDHIDYHPSQQYNRNTTRVNRSDIYTQYGQYHTQTRRLTPYEENFLDTFLKVLYKISTLASEKLQVRCVMETHVVTIYPPLQIVDIGNGCEAYSASIYILAKSELTATMQLITRSQFFLDYNLNYTNVSNFIVWYKTNFVNLTKGEIESLKAKMLKLLTMSMDIFDKLLRI